MNASGYTTAQERDAASAPGQEKPDAFCVLAERLYAVEKLLNKLLPHVHHMAAPAAFRTFAEAMSKARVAFEEFVLEDAKAIEQPIIDAINKAECFGLLPSTQPSILDHAD